MLFVLINSIQSHLSNYVLHYFKVRLLSQSISKFRKNIKTLRTVAFVYITKRDEIVTFSACPQGCVSRISKQNVYALLNPRFKII